MRRAGMCVQFFKGTAKEGLVDKGARAKNEGGRKGVLAFLEEQVMESDCV